MSDLRRGKTKEACRAATRRRGTRQLIENTQASHLHIDGDWPHRSASRFVVHNGIRWHIQVMGEGPCVLLVHGTGASTHSWRHLSNLLQNDLTVVMPDLPGHGYTRAPARFRPTLPHVANALAGLLDHLGMAPREAVGHSAGAAVLLQMCLDQAISPQRTFGINAALLPFEGVAKHLYPSMAKMLFLNPFAPHLFALRAGRPERVRKLIDSTGSKLDDDDLDLYCRLLRDPRHVAGALSMMANWDLVRLKARLAELNTPLTLMAGAEDKAVSPHVAREIGTLLPHAEIIDLDGLGHLAHEEDPKRIAALIKERM